MEWPEVARHLGLEPEGSVLAEGWEVSRAQRPEGDIPFLRAAFVREACQAASLPPDLEAQALAAAGRLASHPVWSALAWHCHWCLFRQPGYPRANIPRWPLLDRLPPEDAGMFYLLVLLSGLPDLLALWRSRQIPQPVVRDTLEDILRWALEYRRVHGLWGLTPRNISWLMNHFRGELYHLVRLQFAFGPFWGRLRAYRHRPSGRVVALSESGVRYRSTDGQVDGSGGVFDPDGGWTAEFHEDESHVTGHPISPRGFAVPKLVQLPKAEWQLVLQPGDPTLHLHIPAGRPLDFEECGASFTAALDFFPRYFPDRPFVAFCCGAWLLDTQLDGLLPPTANLVRFQREFYLFPIRSDGRSTLERVFGGVPTDLSTAPRDTTLRRAILDHLAAGGHLRGGGCFLFPEDLAWGRQVYRSQPWPW